MNKYREYMKSRAFSRSVFFIVFTAVLLYITYFILRDLNTVTSSLFSLLSGISSALSPLWIGLVLAYIINPMVEAIDTRLIQSVQAGYRKKIKGVSSDSSYEGPVEPQKSGYAGKCDRSCDSGRKNRRKADGSRRISIKNGSRLVSILITYVIIICAVIAILYGFAAMLLGQIIITDFSGMLKSFISQIISYESDFRAWAQNLPIDALSEYMQNGINTLFSWLSDTFNASGIISTVSGLSSGVLNFVLGIIVSIYLISDKDFFIGLWNRAIYLIMPKKHCAVNGLLYDIDGVLSSFVRGVLIDSMCVAVLSSIGLSLLGLKFSVFIGVFAGLANVIPYFGPVLGMIPAFLIGTFTDSFLTGFLSIIVLLIVQQIDSNLIYPRVVGSSTGLKPVFVLLAVSVAGHYGGIFGMLLAVPVAGILQILIIRLASHREASILRKEEEASEISSDQEI